MEQVNKSERVIFQISLTKEDYDRIKEDADMLNQTISDYIESLIKEIFEEYSITFKESERI